MMIYRNKKDNRLYYLAKVSPWHILGSRLEAEDVFTGVKIKNVKLKDYDVVARKE